MPCRRRHRGLLPGVVCIIVCIVLGGPSPARGEPAAPPFMRGMALGQLTSYRERPFTRKLTELQGLGVSHVSLVVTWTTDDIYSNQIAPRPRKTTPDSALSRAIKKARAMGFKVFLFPILDVKKRRIKQWRGSLRPQDWEAWWRSYRRFILHYAEIAARAEAELFCVGSELVSTEKMRRRWADLIQRVRKVYPGKLAYSANWDHYAPVSFWDLVDVAGLTAYYRLARHGGATEQEMWRTWKGIRAKILSWSVRTGHPFIFTEVGYPSMVKGAVHPWNYTLGTPVSLKEQTRAYSAFIRAWNGTPELRGVFLWNWHGQGGPQDWRYTPRGKPAESMIRKWFHAMARTRP